MNTRNQTYLLPFLGITLLAIIAVFLLKTKQDSTDQKTFTTNWQSAASFITPRRALAAATYNNYLYVLGGIDELNQYVRTVEYSKINADGQLQQWQTTTRLNEGRFYLAAAAINGYLYAIGGAQGPLGGNNTPVATVEKAKINADGSLGSWEFAQSLTTARRALTVNQRNNNVYALGGYNGIFLHSIEYTTVKDDGSLTPWQLSTEQSKVDRYIHSSALANDNLYLLAGHMRNDQTVSYGDVELSRLTDSGKLSPWHVEATTLLTPRFIAAAFSLGDYLYILAGHDGAKRLNTVEFAPLDDKGHVGSWQHTASLTIPRSGAATATYRNKVYVLGGISEIGVLNSVEVATQAADGGLGHFAIRTH